MEGISRNKNEADTGRRSGVRTEGQKGNKKVRHINRKRWVER